MTGLIAIVGRPNVGKSALFNRIAGKRIAIVHNQPGVTRDRLSAEVEWRGRPVTLVDTGGLGLLAGEKARDVIQQATFDQVALAVEAAHVIMQVVNGQEGLTALDQEVALRLRKAGKPVLLVVNKVDNAQMEEGLADFARLGLDEVFAVSAIHGRGIETLMERAVELLPAAVAAEPGPASATPSPPRERRPRRRRAPAEAQPAVPGAAPAATEASPDEAPPAGPLKLAIVGRPNVGKSSLVNALVTSERVIVSPVPGTTRDAIEVPFTVETDGARESWVLVDTAGIRKTRRVADSIEFFSVKRAEEAIERCDLAILVLDATAGILEQDKKIADRIVAARRACIVVVNKWDLVEAEVSQDGATKLKTRRLAGRRDGRRHQPAGLAEFGQWVQERLFFLDYAPVIFTSATSGFHLDRLLEAVRYVASQLRQRVPTALLNRVLRDAIERRQPVSATGTHLKFFYATQVGQRPPVFLLFVNRREVFSEPYARSLGRELRKAFGFEGCPIVLLARARPKAPRPGGGRRESRGAR